jgi:hypothetical protein
VPIPLMPYASGFMNNKWVRREARAVQYKLNKYYKRRPFWARSMGAGSTPSHEEGRSPHLAVTGVLAASNTLCFFFSMPPEPPGAQPEGGQLTQTTEQREDLERVMRTIQKLLSTEGRTPEEAAVFVEKAQSLLAKYDLTMESIDDLKADKRTGVKKGDAIIKTTEGKPDGWKADLLEAIARVHDCVVIYVREMETSPSGKTRRMVKHGKIAGFGHDVEAAGYEMAFLIREIERLAQAYADGMWAEIRGIEKANGMTHQQAEKYYVERTGRHPLKAKLWFTKGAVETVIENVRRWKYQRDEQARKDNPHAIVLQKRQVVEDQIRADEMGITVEQLHAKRAEQAAQMRKWQAEREAELANAEAIVKPEPQETPAQRRKREEAELRRQQRQRDAWRRQDAREAARKDRHAVLAGREAGSRVSVRPGIREGGKSAGDLD